MNVNMEKILEIFYFSINAANKKYGTISKAIMNGEKTNIKIDITRV